MRAMRRHGGNIDPEVARGAALVWGAQTGRGACIAKWRRGRSDSERCRGTGSGGFTLQGAR
eukprot:14576214-Alexandrium_andersonii.AAC.1